MSEEKVKREVTPDDLKKQLANVAYTVRRIKDWLEEKMGADIDGDGRIGSGPYRKVKRVGLFLAVALGLAVSSNAGNTNIARWTGTDANPTSYIDSSGGIHASTFYGSAAGLTAIPAGSIANGSISNVHLATNAVTSIRINDGTVSNVDLASGISAAKLDPGTVMTAVDINAATNINSTNLTGDIPSARLTVNGVVVSDFAAANDVLVGTGAGTFSAVTGSGARVVTNASTLSTNLMYFGSGGVLLSNVYNGP